MNRADSPPMLEVSTCSFNKINEVHYVTIVDFLLTSREECLRPGEEGLSTTTSMNSFGVIDLERDLILKETYDPSCLAFFKASILFKAFSLLI